MRNNEPVHRRVPVGRPLRCQLMRRCSAQIAARRYRSVPQQRAVLFREGGPSLEIVQCFVRISSLEMLTN